MIPGVASVEVLSATPGISKISVVPTFIVGPGAKYPPIGDVLAQAKEDPQFFSGKIWLMESGSWQIRLKVDGAQGPGELAVPVPAFARRTLPMTRPMGVLLFALMALLVVAFISILGAARRESTLAAGAVPPEKNRRGARIVMATAGLLVLAILFGGNYWWDSAAAEKARNMIYEAPSMDVTLDSTSNKTTLEMANSLWHSRRPETVMTKLVPDHGHLMHLFLLREPGLDAFYHLHPQMVATPAKKSEDISDTFEISLSPLAPGKYQVFADVVRESGFPDTMTAEIEIPSTTSATVTALTGDDSSAITKSLGAAAITADGPDGPVFTLPDGYKMAWVRGTAPLVANQFTWLRFRLEDPQGKPATDARTLHGHGRPRRNRRRRPLRLRPHPPRRLRRHGRPRNDPASRERRAGFHR